MTVKVIQCLKWWIKEGLVDDILASLQMNEDEDE